MANWRDSSCHPQDWTMRKLLREIRGFANFERFGGTIEVDASKNDYLRDDGPALREGTHLYRDTWLNPLLDELDRRLIKPKPEGK